MQHGTNTAILITALRFVASFNAIGSLQPLMLSELGDYQQVKTGYRLDGFIQTMAYSVPMVVTQLCSLIPAVIQGKVGFNPNNYIITEGANGLETNQMPENVLSQELVQTADRYANIAIWISVASGALMLIALCFYTLSKKKHAEAVAELKARSVNTENIESEKGELNLLENVKGVTAKTLRSNAGDEESKQGKASTALTDAAEESADKTEPPQGAEEKGEGE